MSTLQLLKTFINQRLAVAVDDIFSLLETTISNYEEAMDRQRRLLVDERSEFLQSRSVVKKRDMTEMPRRIPMERVQDLISDYRTAEEKVHEDLKTQEMRIYACQQPGAVGIIIDGTPVLTGLDNVSRACGLLFGRT